MIFLNTILLGGLLAATAPVIVHILHRRKVTRIDWGAMRFLLELLAKSKRSIFIENLLLLAIRMLALVCLALAFTRPALEPGQSEAGVIDRSGRTAAVLLVDDSLSAGTGRSETRLQRMQALATIYLDSLDEGEISILRLSELQQRLPDPILDVDLAKELVRSWEPKPTGSDWPALLEAGLRQAGKHINPNVEIVLIGDGGAEGWALQARARWADLRSRLHVDDEAAIGSRLRPRLLLLQSPVIEGEQNLAISDISMDRSVVPAHRPVGLFVHLQHRGEESAEGAVLKLLVDDQVVDERPVQIEAGGSQVVSFQHTFRRGGSHLLEARLEGARDHLAADDQRFHAVEVVAGLPVLLVAGRPGAGLAGSLGFTELALAPERQDEQAADDEAGSRNHGSGDRAVAGDEAAVEQLFAVTTITATELAHTDLEGYRVVVLGDLAGLDNDTLSRIEHFVVAGGGVLVGLGPQTDIEHVNRFWAREGDGFLPCPLTEVVDAEGPLTPSVHERMHPALSAFQSDSGQAWTGSKVERYIGFRTDAVKPEELVVPLRLSDGTPLLIERRRGLGLVAMLSTSLDLHWSSLVTQPAYVPLLRGLVGHLGGQVTPPRNLQPGDRLAHATSGGAHELTATGPSGAVVLRPGTWQGRAVHASEPLHEPGSYLVEDGDTKIHYAMAPAPGESRLERLAASERDQTFAGMELLHFEDPEELGQALDVVVEDNTELWQWLLLAAVGLLFCETLYTRRQSRREQAGQA